MITIKKFAPFLVLVIAASCASFIKENETAQLRDYEKKLFVLLKDVRAGDKSLNRGSTVRVKIAVGGNWVKVYGINTEVDSLKSERVLLLFLFDDDFPFGRFDMGLLKIRLFQMVKPRE